MRGEFYSEENWRRRFLPHYDQKEKYQAITYRQADSLPKKVFEQTAKLKNNESSKRLFIDQALDRSLGSCLLTQKNNAEIIINNWLFFDKSKYDLIAYVVMLNHVHILIKTHEALDTIIHSWKSYTAHKISIPSDRHEHRNLWQREYWDRFIRNESHFYKTINYIHNNPVKARLVKNAIDWEWSSYHKFYDN